MSRGDFIIYKGQRGHLLGCAYVLHAVVLEKSERSSFLVQKATRARMSPKSPEKSSAFNDVSVGRF